MQKCRAFIFAHLYPLTGFFNLSEPVRGFVFPARCFLLLPPCRNIQAAELMRRGSTGGLEAEMERRRSSLHSFILLFSFLSLPKAVLGKKTALWLSHNLLGCGLQFHPYHSAKQIAPLRRPHNLSSRKK